MGPQGIYFSPRSRRTSRDYGCGSVSGGRAQKLSFGGNGAEKSHYTQNTVRITAVRLWNERGADELRKVCNTSDISGRESAS